MRCSAESACPVVLGRAIETGTDGENENMTWNDALAISQPSSNAQEAREGVCRRRQRVFGYSSPARCDENGTGSGFERLALDDAPTYSGFHVHGVRRHAEVATGADPADVRPRVHAVAKDETLGGMAAMEVGYRDGELLLQKSSQHEVQDAVASAGTARDDAAAESDEESQEAIAVVVWTVWKLGWSRAWSKSWTQVPKAYPVTALVQYWRTSMEALIAEGSTLVVRAHSQVETCVIQA